jgi:diacylglycerol kinase family enzyme
MALKKGKHEKNSNVNKIQTDRIIIETEKNEKFNVDGEVIEGKKFDIKIIKNAVKLYNNKELVEKILNYK